MNNILLANSLLSIAKKLLASEKAIKSKTYPMILDRSTGTQNAQLWRAIEDVAADIYHMADEDEDATRSNLLAKSKARELASKFAEYYSGMWKSELEKTILEYIWESYHNIDL